MSRTAQKAVAKARDALALAEMKLDNERRRRRILCSCGKQHPIGKLELLITHYYHEPHGCTGGDYWSEGEWQFICPDTRVRNRLLFFGDYELPWKERGGTASAAEMFKRIYRNLFASSQRVHGDAEERGVSPQSWNNEYVDEHRERFELPARAGRK